MDYLFALRDQDIFQNPEFPEPTQEYEKRTTVKAVAINDEGKFGFVTNSVHGCILLAGGGAESDDLNAEIVRECREELSCEVEVVEKIGVAHEFRNRNNTEYETSCFLVKALEKVEYDHRTEGEKKINLQVVWLDKNEALSILRKQKEKLKSEKIDFYNTSFNIVRDICFFEKYLNDLS